MIKTQNVKLIDVSDWNKLVSDTYGKIYKLQQQEECNQRGVIKINIPDDDFEEGGMHDKIPEIINDETHMGVKFNVWLDRDPKEPLNPSDDDLKSCNYYHNSSNRKEWCNDIDHIVLFWERNFYPLLQSVANDLHKKGLIELGYYLIEIDW